MVIKITLFVFITYFLKFIYHSIHLINTTRGLCHLLKFSHMIIQAILSDLNVCSKKKKEKKLSVYGGKKQVSSMIFH